MNLEEFDMPSRYDATITEASWYAKWEAAGLFQPEDNPDKAPYCITIPPPNITGSLHMGHALCYPIQDALGRYQRLRGKKVLILPGQDHAGIATQSVVDKQLRKAGTSAAQIGRDAFVEKVWEWRKESGDTILNQLRKLGCAFDWSRSRFTFDPQYHDAVLRVFIDWFERGLIFRGKRVVNWDPVLRTSVSDIETERQTVRGKLYHIRYEFTDGSGSVTIATTRPETMLADVAVAVHPSDKRYEGKVGKTLRLPLVGREIPLIADIYPDPNFGTGAVKITPSHDPNDFQVGQRHNLEMPVVLDERAKVTVKEILAFAKNPPLREGREGELLAPNAESGEGFDARAFLESLDGLDRYDARKRIIAALEESGEMVKIEDHDINIVVSDRSKEVIEPLLSEQWFCDQPALAGPAIKAVQDGKIKFTPERYNRIFLDWMENIREWCISRQLWWGHRIPIYYTEEGQCFAALSWEDAQAKAGDQKIVRQDDDVLDTWFSSGLWPFATLGWPEETADLKAWYPTSVLVTDRNIINLWVARMVMMGLDFRGEIPFSDVMIYATVLTEDGKRMSKSLGTGVDPMGIIETKGADSLRWTLMSQTGANQDIRYSDKKTDDARNWGNKIWNATRFILMNAGDLTATQTFETIEPKLEPVDRWLLSRLHATERAVRAAYDGYDLQGACQALYQFFWSELCDWYIEVSKPRLQDPAQREVPFWCLVQSIEAFLKMLHPVMPHLTEELYSYLPISGKTPFIMSAAWPEISDRLANSEAEAEMARIFEIVTGLRSLRHSLEITPMKTLPVAYFEGELAGGTEVVRSQGWIEELRPGKPEGRSLSVSREGVEIHLPIDGVVDVERLITAAKREQEKLTKELEGITNRLSNPQFVERAKPEVIERDRGAATELDSRLAKLQERIDLLDN